MVISVSNTGVLSSNTGLLDEIGQYMTFYDEANTTLYFDATGRFPYSTSTSGTWLNLAPTAKLIVANTSALGATIANTYGPNAMIFNNSATTAGRIDRTAASNTIIIPAVTSGTGKMTAAVWAYHTNWYTTSGQRFVSSTQSGGWSIAINDGGFTGTTSVGIVFYNITAGGYRYMSANTRDAFASSTGWNHLAWTFDGKNAYFYINGQVANTSTAVAATNYINVGGCLAIGAEASSSTATTSPYLSGAMASIFVSNRSFSNTEIYNLFVDTDPNIDLSGSRTYVVNSTYSTATTIAPNTPAKYYSNGALRTTGTIGFDEVSMSSGSLFFNNAQSQYLSVAHSTALNLTSGDFTIELWAYFNDVTNSGIILNKDGVFNASYPQYSLSVGSGVVAFEFGNGAGVSPTVTSYAAGSVAVGQWYHIAAVRTGSTIKTFLNGIQITSTSQGTAMSDGGKPLLIGIQSGFSNYFNGSISNLRILKGTALYTANFAPPKSSILEAVPNTSLLLQCANSTTATVDSSPNKFTVTNNGSVTYNANTIFDYTPSGTVVQKIYSDGTIAVANSIDETNPFFIVYSLGTAGAGGSGASSGSVGGNTTLTFNSITITGFGGGAGLYNSGTVPAGGSFSGGDGGSTGGNSASTTGDRGGGSGGAIGGTAGTNTTPDGSAGASPADVSGLFSALTGTGFSSGAGGTAGPRGAAGASVNINNGGNASGIGAGGGSAGFYGGNGGNGSYGGGGGGAAGYTATQTGGTGGQGVIVLQITTNSGTSNTVLTSGTSYTLPAGTISFKAWAIGAGGGGGGCGPVDSSSASGGGAGGVAYRTWTL
jgi:hypothetical protein